MVSATLPLFWFSSLRSLGQKLEIFDVARANHHKVTSIKSTNLSYIETFGQRC